MKISNFKFKILNSRKGFTIVELIVVMAVFLFVVGITISIFISVVQNQRKILQEQELTNQISYVLEYMGRALRMAGNDMASGDCTQDQDKKYVYLLTRYSTPDGAWQGIRFVNQTAGDICHEFFLENNANGELILKEKKGNGPDAVVSELISEKFKINSLSFVVNGASDPTNKGAVEGDSLQPRVTILLNVETKGQIKSSKIIQTTISRRDLNVNAE